MGATFNKSLLSAAIIFLSLSASAAEPSGYYSSCTGLSGANLLSQLKNVVSNHTNIGYNSLWTLYKTSDVYPDGKIWDMYSTKHFTYSSDQCGNYKNVGDCYNREHSMPKSWFNEGSPMVSDAFHIYPTDGKVNGQRSNYPYGECAGGTTLPGSGSVKALGRLGNSTFSGYSGIVFEPDDEYKGDFARSYFYMAAAYNDVIKNWDSSGTNLGGTSYPVFNSWSLQLLLKWHRNDPVSQKEIDRNEAVYAKQRNRNPFIDHPEMVEHIWGNKTSVGWNSAATVTPDLTTPVEGSTVNLGSTVPNSAKTVTIAVKGSNLTSNVTASVTGSGFSVSPASLTAATVNSTTGGSLTVTFRPSAVGSYTGTLKLVCGSITRTVNLTGSAQGTLPAGPVEGVSDDSFDAIWSYVGDDNNGKYTLNVMHQGVSISGYPRSVDAEAERFVVEGLEPQTTYTYQVSSKSMTSNQVSVTTLAPIPSVAVMFDGILEFYAEPGEPSEAAELLLLIDNIENDINLSVSAPFQLSDDKTSWGTSLTISPEQDRVYLRMYSQTFGTFTGSLLITSDAYRNDQVEFIGYAGSRSGFYEDFEADARDFENLDGGFYAGTGAHWKFIDAGIFPEEDEPHEGLQAVKFGASSGSLIEMDENTAGGIGKVTFWAKKATATTDVVPLVLEYSEDNGHTWTRAGVAQVSSTSYNQYSFEINSGSPVRLRVSKPTGQYIVIDDIEGTSYTASLVPAEVADYHRWDAYCFDGRLVVECHEPLTVSIYALDGTVVFVGNLSAGHTSFDLSPELYIVAVDDFARRVLVK